jgi:hypothetical protein
MASGRRLEGMEVECGRGLVTIRIKIYWPDHLITDITDR